MTINEFEKLRKEVKKLDVEMYYDFKTKKAILEHMKFISKINIEYIDNFKDIDFIRAVKINIMSYQH